MRFASPQILWLLLVLPPALMLFLWWAGRKKQALLGRFIESRLLNELLAGVSPTRRKVRWALLVAAVVFAVFTLARPQWGFDWEKARQRGLDIVVAIDTSKSMLAENVAPNRLARAKLAALDLMQQAKSDRLGLVAFAGNAFMECPLTIDDVAFQQCVETLDVNTIPLGGTAIAEAIETAAKSFKYEADNFKVLVILTDGKDHDPHAVEAATQAAKTGMKIFTVGLGTAEGGLLPIKEADGRTDFVHDEAGNVVKSRLDEPLLQKIAAAGGGFYLPLRGAKTMETLYERGLAPLPKTEGKEKFIRRYHERFYWPLAAAILLLVVEMLFPERMRTARQAKTVAMLARATPTVATALALLLAPLTASASPSQALRDYRTGRSDNALKEYQRLIRKKTDDPRLSFNAGAAAYRDGQFEAAAKHFGEGLAAPDLEIQQHVYYNLGNTFYRIGERAHEPDKTQAAWEKSLKEYESSLKLDPKDGDAKFNHEFVKRKLKELRQQQQNQQQQKNQNQNQRQQQSQQQEQQKQEDQAKQEQEKKEQQQQQEEQQKRQDQNQSGQEQKQQEHQAEQKSQQQQEKQQAQAGQQEEEQKQSQSAKPQPSEEEQKEGEQREAVAGQTGEMKPQQARQLLDAQKAQEAMIPLRPEVKPENRERVFKDW